MKITLENNSVSVLSTLTEAKEKILYAIGLEWLKICTVLVTENKIVDTGRLRASLSFITQKNKGQNTSTTVTQVSDQLTGSAEKDELIVGTNVEYASYIENGTYKMSSRPFLNNSVMYYADDYKNLAEDILSADI